MASINPDWDFGAHRRSGGVENLSSAQSRKLRMNDDQLLALLYGNITSWEELEHPVQAVSAVVNSEGLPKLFAAGNPKPLQNIGCPNSKPKFALS